MLRFLTLGLSFLLVIFEVQGGPLALTLPAGINSSQFRVTTFASGLSYPYSLQPMPDGSLLVGVSIPDASGDYFSAHGGVLRLTDNGSGVASGPGTMVYSNFPYPVQGLRLIGSSLVAVAIIGAGHGQIVFLRPGTNPNDPYTNVGLVDFASPDPGFLFNMTLGTRPTPGQAGSYDLFFSLNGGDSSSLPGQVTVSGLATGTLEFSSVGKITITPGPGTPVVSGLQQIARGLRNTAGIGTDPGSGALYLTDNGWDVPGTFNPQNADELNQLTAAQIGNGVADFGFPNNYIEYRTGNFVGGAGIPPLAAFQPYPNPNTGAESLGASEVAMAPAGFPNGLNSGVFVTFYGKWEQGGAANNTGPVLYYDFGAHSYQPFITSGQTGIGHMASLAATSTALYIADMNSTGKVRSGIQNGVIYKIESVSPIAIYNTGVTTPGTLAADGSVDAHYRIVASPDAAAPGPNSYLIDSAQYPFPYWMANGPNSKWIAPLFSQSPGNKPGAYTYRTTFDLTGYNPLTASLSGQAGADNSVVVRLNGTAVTGSLSGFQTLNPFTINSGFVAGVNTLDFVVTNDAPNTNPTGLRVEISGTVATASGPPVTVAVSPKTVTLGPSQPQSFTATVTGSSNTAVSWSLNPNIGTINGGVYTAPLVIGSSQTVTLTAVSLANGTSSDSATITLSPSAQNGSTAHGSASVGRIPSNPLATSGTVISDITIPTTGAVASGNALTVNLIGLQHDWAGDLIATLSFIDSQGTVVRSVDLLNRIGQSANLAYGASADFGDGTGAGGNYSFNSDFSTGLANTAACADQPACTTAMADADVIPPGQYFSSGAGGIKTNLSYAFAGLDVNAGSWRLTVTDASDPNAGSLIGWEIFIQTASSGQVSAPQFSPPGATYTSAQSVTISTTTPGATIRYTTDGVTTPTSTTGTVYSGAVTVSSSMTLKAIAYAAGMTDSAVSSATYVINQPQVATPVFNPGAGTYTSAQSVTISSATPGAAIRYTTDGVTTPSSTTGTLYSGAVSVSSSMTLKAIAYAAGMTDSAVSSAAYVINQPQVATPVFNPPAGTYTSAQSVTISTTTAGAAIRYTTDGVTTPSSTTGTVYSGAIAVNSTTTIKAIAYLSGSSDSAVATALYTINAGGGGAGWYSPSWAHRKKITINGAQVSGTLAQFPLLVSLASDVDLKIGAQATGADLVFTQSDGTTKLAHEIESYTSSTGQLVAWVQVPQLSSTTVVYLYYGNPSAADQSNRTAVWDPGYRGVWHMSGSGALNSGDSTVNANGVVTSGSPGLVGGQIGGAGNFASGSQYGGAGGQSIADTGVGTGSRTISGWVNFNRLYGADSNPTGIFGTNGTSYPYTVTAFAISNAGQVRMDVDDNGAVRHSSGYSAALTAGTWYYLSGVYDGASLKLYMNGALVNTTALSFTPGGGKLIINAMSGYGRYEDVKLDELRVSNVARNANWIAAEYNNQSSPATFYTVGLEENSGSGGGTVAAPQFSPPGATYTSAQSVTISTTTAGAAIRYTTDGVTTPSSTTGTVYSGAVSVSSSMTLKAIAYAAGMTDSAVSSAAYVINQPQVATPVFNPPAGTYTSAQSVTISTATAGAAIRYTTDGVTTPSSTIGTVYSGAIAVNSTTTIKAIAYLSGSSDSAVATALYTINAGGGAGWYSPSWAHRKKITVNGAQVSGTLAQFPLLVSLASDVDLKIGAQATGADIVFTQADGTTKLAHEIESYTSSTGQLVAWVQVPQLSATTVLYLYYGNASAADQSNRTAVWDPGYRGVWHMSGSGALNSGDSTVNANGVVTSGSPGLVGGQIGGAGNFASGSQYGGAGGQSSGDTGVGTGSRTVSGWVNFNRLYGADSNPTGIFGTNGTSYPYTVTAFAISNAGQVRMDVDDNGAVRHSSGYSAALTAGSWYYLSGVYDGAALKLYMNGALVNTTALSITPGGGKLIINGMSGYGRYEDVKLDELRVSNVVRNANWIAVEYNNQSSPATFYTVGLEENSGSGGGTVAAPQFSPPGATYTSAQSVTISTTTAGAAIRYTTDGVTTPSSTIGTVYSGAIAVSSSMTLKAIAYAGGMTDSAVSSAAYVINQPQVATPQFNPPAGTYTSAQSVTISTTTAGAAIRYTTDGVTTPSSTTGTVYSGAIAVNSTTTIKAIAYLSGSSDSAVATALYTINAGGGGAGWYSPSWAHRKKITINGAQVSGTLAQFPLLVSLASDVDLKIGAQATGADIVFTQGDGTTKLAHEIESYTSSTGQLVAWVQVPQLSSTTVLYLYYGNPSAADQSNRTAVWDPGYRGVWHMSGSGALNSGDSTVNANGVVTSGSPGLVGGQIGGAGNFASGSQYGGAGGQSSGDTGVGTGSRTVSGWVNFNRLYGADSNPTGIFGTNGTSYPYTVTAFAISNAGQVRMDVDDNGAVRHSSGYSAALTAGSWYYLAGVYDGASLKLYMNGALVNTTAMSITPGGGKLIINGMSGYGRYEDVKLDELRVSNVVRSANWIAAEYNNQSSPATFYTVGPAE